MLFIKYINLVQLVGIQIYNLDIARMKNQRNEIVDDGYAQIDSILRSTQQP